mmetsp:Transcript_7936/g.13318  ORF Transcript_7936/g.13318 Transcript_7936/m.13318 type:complete len:315 (-) Transcript_7936:704-1648(-)
MDEELAVAHLFVLETLDAGVLASHGVVGPLDQVVLGLVANQSEVVELDELPDHGEHVLLLALGDVDAAHADELDLELLAGLNHGVVVDVLAEVVLGLRVDLLPLDNALVDLVQHFVEEDAVLDLLTQVVHVDILDAQRVDPQSEGSLLSGALDVVVDHGSGLVLLGSQVLETVLGVEDVGDEKSVDLHVSSRDVAGSDHVGHAQGQGVRDHLLGSGLETLIVHSVQRALRGVESVEHVEEGDGVREVLSEVGDLLGLACLAEVVVDPSDEDGLGGELEQIFELLTLLKQSEDLGSVLERDLLGNDHPNGLPDAA